MGGERGSVVAADGNPRERFTVQIPRLLQEDASPKRARNLTSELLLELMYSFKLGRSTNVFQFQETIFMIG